MGRLGAWIALVLAAGFLPLACSPRQAAPTPRFSGPLIRVRLMAGVEQVTLHVAAPPTIKSASESTALRLNLPPTSNASLAWTGSHWTIGGVAVPGSGALTCWQSDDGAVRLNGKAYRGKFRFVPAGGKTFDVINDVNIDAYLQSVVPREMLRHWQEEAYKAQAIVARTYALYEAHTAGLHRQWDVYSDQRSQVYGGMDDETARSRSAVQETAGIVVVYGQPGQERIFKAYFSSCCGGVTQSAADAFGEAYMLPLSDQDVHGLCSRDENPHYNWGPVEITKDDLTHRLRAWGQKRGRPERNMAAVSKLDIQWVNRFDRPIRFVVTDAAGVRYSLGGEELRNAIDAGATKALPAHLPSSYCKVVSDPGSNVIRFVEGHGLGHGVGMCQWCAEIRAEAGMRHEDIVLCAFPRAKLVRAY